MKLKYIFAVGVMALLASCDESRFMAKYVRTMLIKAVAV